MDPEEKVIEALCLTCGGDIWSGDGRYARGLGLYDCESCGEKVQRFMKIARGSCEAI